MSFFNPVVHEAWNDDIVEPALELWTDLVIDHIGQMIFRLFAGVVND